MTAPQRSRASLRSRFRPIRIAQRAASRASAVRSTPHVRSAGIRSRKGSLTTPSGPRRARAGRPAAQQTGPMAKATRARSQSMRSDGTGSRDGSTSRPARFAARAGRRARHAAGVESARVFRSPSLATQSSYCDKQDYLAVTLRVRAAGFPSRCRMGPVRPTGRGHRGAAPRQPTGRPRTRRRRSSAARLGRSACKARRCYPASRCRARRFPLDVRDGPSIKTAKSDADPVQARVAHSFPGPRWPVTT